MDFQKRVIIIIVVDGMNNEVNRKETCRFKSEFKWLKQKKVTLNLGAHCVFSKFKIKIRNKFYPTAVYSKYFRRTVLPKNSSQQLQHAAVRVQQEKSFDTYTCEYDTHECDKDTHKCNSYTQSVISKCFCNARI
jgi:hypothetical protein